MFSLEYILCPRNMWYSFILLKKHTFPWSQGQELPIKNNLKKKIDNNMVYILRKLGTCKRKQSETWFLPGWQLISASFRSYAPAVKLSVQYCKTTPAQSGFPNYHKSLGSSCKYVEMEGYWTSPGARAAPVCICPCVRNARRPKLHSDVQAISTPTVKYSYKAIRASPWPQYHHWKLLKSELAHHLILQFT